MFGKHIHRLQHLHELRNAYREHRHEHGFHHGHEHDFHHGHEHGFGHPEEHDEESYAEQHWCSPRGIEHLQRALRHLESFGDDPSGGGRRHRQRRGDIKYALLELLAEQPRHGYELIKELESRYAGFYRPSPGSVYPNLQLLEDEGHLTSTTVDGKRVYTITDSGRQLLQEWQQEVANDETHRHPFRPGRGGPELGGLREGGMALMASLVEMAHHGTPEQIRTTVELLDATRRKIYSILAADSDDQPPTEK